MLILKAEEPANSFFWFHVLGIFLWFILLLYLIIFRRFTQNISRWHLHSLFLFTVVLWFYLLQPLARYPLEYDPWWSINDIYVECLLILILTNARSMYTDDIAHLLKHGQLTEWLGVKCNHDGLLVGTLWMRVIRHVKHWRVDDTYVRLVA